MNPSTSTARVEANRRNARRSTGPKTDAGKASSRRNALKHGLTATVVDLDDRLGSPGHGQPDQVEDRAGSVPPWRGWLSEQAARTIGQINRVGRIEIRLRDQAVWRALAVWEDDRMVDAEDLGAGLSRDPSRTVARLRLTPQGCDWLIKRWGWLAQAAETVPTGWTEAQAGLAFDLLGTAEEGRIGPVCGANTALELARTRIDELLAQRDTVDEADLIAQSLAQADLVDTPTPELARLRRYETALHKRLGWLLGELRGDAPGAKRPSPRTEPPVAAEAAAELPLPPNEADDAPTRCETKPTPPSTATATPPHSPSPPTRNRPDLAKLARRDQQKQRKRRRQRQQA